MSYLSQTIGDCFLWPFSSSQENVISYVPKSPVHSHAYVCLRLTDSSAVCLHGSTWVWLGNVIHISCSPIKIKYLWRCAAAWREKREGVIGSTCGRLRSTAYGLSTNRARKTTAPSTCAGWSYEASAGVLQIRSSAKWYCQFLLLFPEARRLSMFFHCLFFMV